MAAKFNQLVKPRRDGIIEPNSHDLPIISPRMGLNKQMRFDTTIIATLRVLNAMLALLI